MQSVDESSDNIQSTSIIKDNEFDCNQLENIDQLDMNTPVTTKQNLNRKINKLVSSNDVTNNSYDNQFYSSIKLAKQVRDMQAQKS